MEHARIFGIYIFIFLTTSSIYIYMFTFLYIVTKQRVSCARIRKDPVRSVAINFVWI